MAKTGYSGSDAIRFWNKIHGPIKVERKSTPKSGRPYLENECRLCRSTETLEVHHIIPVAIGGYSTKQNSITLCKACHLKISKYYQAIGIMGHVVEWHERKKVV